MDAGIAALWASAIGAISGIGGGTVGAWLTGKKQQSIADAADRREQERWLRQQRQAAYASAMAAYDEFTSAVSPLTGPSRKHQPLSAEARGAINNTEYAVVQACARISLVGPDTVRAAAQSLSDSIVALSDALRQQLQVADIDPLVEAVAREYRLFMTEARAVVTD